MSCDSGRFPANGNRHGATRIEAANRFVQRGNVDRRRHDRHRHLHLDRSHRRDLAIAWWYPAGLASRWELLALTGALSYAELSASLPYAGGDYIYIREAYGKLLGFLSGWSSFLVTFSGAIAFLAVSLSGFMAFFFPVLGSERVIFSLAIPWVPITATAGTIFAIIGVLLLSGLHCLGVRQGTMVQNILTILKIGALLGIILFGILFGRGDTAHFVPLFDWQKRRCEFLDTLTCPLPYRLR